MVLIVPGLGMCQAAGSNAEGRQKTMRQTTAANRISGYAGNPEDWERFLTCWHDAAVARHRELLKQSADYPFRTVLGNHFERDAAPAMEVGEAISQSENRLGVALPKSYKDFLIAWSSLSRKGRLTNGKESSNPVKMYPVGQADFLVRLDAELVEDLERWPVDTRDEKYFVYGTQQDSASGRTKYLRGSIAVGRYSSDSFGFMLLNPQVRTSDGEMEASLLEHSGEFRAPSFAELMRQLSILETTSVQTMPPYPQRSLVGTCAAKLPMAQIGWE